MNSLVLEAPAGRTESRARFSAGAALLWVGGGALVAMAVFLRGWHLGQIPGLNGDEAWYGVQASLAARGDDIAWLTPTGNPLNPFFFIPLVALHYFFGPSIALLRLTALVSGLAALAVNYVLCRRAFDAPTAIVSTLLLAVLPIDIAYSRFAWDASQSLLVTVLVMYLPLARLRTSDGHAAITTAAIVACGAAILVHPTNGFAAMFLIVPALYVRRQRIATTLRQTTIPAKTWAFAGLIGVLAAAALLVSHWGEAAMRRLHGPGELGLFAANYVRLFSGTTVYQYISGAGLETPQAGWFAYTTGACNVGFALLAVWTLWGMFARIQKEPAAVDACLLPAWLAMLAGFFIVAGPQAIAPHFERYGICLVAPGALVMARGGTWWIEQARPHGGRLALLLVVLAWLWLVSFYVNYFQCFFQTGGLSHKTFRTASVEPKLAALGYVLEHRSGDKPIEIVCHEWWNYWPIRYLAFRQPNVSVVTWDARRRAAGDEQSPRTADTWFVEFAGSAGEDEVIRELRASGRVAPRHTIDDYGRRALISVVGPVENSSQIY